MAEIEASALKEVLCDQDQAMLKLSMELEKEREASASAASEALSMILRLQEERSAERMEARQYKRMAEERMRHVEGHFSILEEVMNVKEMEIAYLESQVRAYRHKLLSIGFSDTNVNDMGNWGNLTFHGILRRNESLPVVCYKNLYSDNVVCESKKLALHPELSFHEKIDEVLNHDFDFLQQSSSDVEIIEGEMESGCDLANGDLQTETVPHHANLEKSCSWYSTVSSDASYKSTKGVTGIKSDFPNESSFSGSQVEGKKNLHGVDVFRNLGPETEAIGSGICSTSFRDIFPDEKNLKEAFQLHKVSRQNLMSEAESKFRIPDSMLEDVSEHSVRDEEEWIKKENISKIEVPFSHSFASVDPKLTFLPSFEIRSLSERIQLLEDSRKNMQHEHSGSGEEQMMLLRQIAEKLNTIQSHINPPKAKKRPSVNESSWVSLMEVAVEEEIPSDDVKVAVVSPPRYLFNRSKSSAASIMKTKKIPGATYPIDPQSKLAVELTEFATPKASISHEWENQSLEVWKAASGYDPH
ncbi:hypothetical protein QJS10_CPA02g01344 [Acorus calamus]|uniref:GTD-binding domain-containing protein n=1 Tax=Acorus calamus TaxID=4465 RepID=A0AAV9FDU3_ACOCL|nr:hypothetical protein QJS10_CPA02g01344 [Acorus calamus]